MEEDFRALLTGWAPVTALVPAGSINWRRHPQGRPLPGLVLHLINSSHGYLLSDVTDISAVRVQVNCLALTYAEAKALTRAMIARLSGYQAGPFYQIRLAGERDVEASGANAPDDAAAVMLDFTFQYRRS